MAEFRQLMTISLQIHRPSTSDVGSYVIADEAHAFDAVDPAQRRFVRLPDLGRSLSAYDGTVAEHLNEYDKRDHALALAAERGVPAQRCCAIGDTRSDIPLFDVLPTSLALNAGAAARAAATTAIATQDITEFVPWSQEWERGLD